MAYNSEIGVVVSNYHPPYLTPKNEVVYGFFQGSIHLVQKLETLRTGGKIPHETMLQHESDPSVATRSGAIRDTISRV